jgi:beta-aspartyl-dipeptidase (metallo-type)
MAWTLLRGGHVFDPEDRGIADVLIVGTRIVAVGERLAAPTGIGEGDAVDVAGRILLPGLLDAHLHVMGANGMGGPATRSTDLQIDRIVPTGTTTVVSPLGADSLSRSIPALLGRAAALECEGISAYCYTGGWCNPVPTLTGNPQADVAYVDRVVGVKVSISEPMAPVYTIDELCRLAHAAFTGGRIAGKGAVLHAHVGDLPEGLTPLVEVHRRTGIPLRSMIPTHVNRNPVLWQQALEYAQDGGTIDLTGSQRPEAGHRQAISPARAIREALEAGLPTDRITLSSDGGAALQRFDAHGRSVGSYMPGPEFLLQTVRELVEGGLSWGAAARVASSNPAEALGLSRKGRIVPGRDADLLLLTPAGEVDRVFARGRLVVRDGKPLVRGPFDGHTMPSPGLFTKEP